MKILLLTIVCVFPALSQTPAAEAALARVRAKKVSADARITAYERTLAAEPGNRQAAMQLASAYVQKTRETGDGAYLGRAETLVNKVLALDGKDVAALRVRNLIAMNRHEFPQVAATAKQILAAAPEDAQTWGILGDAQMEMGLYKDAYASYQRMLRIKPGMHSYNRIAWYHHVTGDTTKAIAIMKDAVVTANGFAENKAWCLVELGNLRFKVGQMAEAEAAYREAIAAFPRMHSAHAGLGMVSAAQGRPGPAIEHYLKAQAIVPLVQYSAALAELYTAAGRSAEAQRENAMIDVNAKLERAAGQKANRTLALVYADQQRNLDEALDLVKSDLEVRKDVFTWDALAWVLYRRGDFAGARQASLEALKFHTAEPAFYFHAGMIADAGGDRAEAKRLLERALALNDRFDAAKADLARRTLARISPALAGASVPQPR
jgi:tetratricopeptide (TPR) repeat protein